MIGFNSYSTTAQSFEERVARIKRARREFEREAARALARAASLAELRERSRIAGEDSRRLDQAPAVHLPGRRPRCSVPRSFSFYQGDFA